MKTHFVKLRRLMAVASVLGPMLFFCAFILCAAGIGFWFLLPVALGGILLSMLPTKVAGEPSPVRAESKLEMFLGVFGIALFAQWVVGLPGFWEMVELATVERAMLDWRLVLPVLIWVCRWGILNYRRVADLEDREIVEFYEDEPKVSA